MTSHPDGISTLERFAENVAFGDEFLGATGMGDALRDFEQVEMIAASLQVALLEAEDEIEPMPSDLRGRITIPTESPSQSAPEEHPVIARIDSDEQGNVRVTQSKSNPWVIISGWAAAAALAIVAGIGWMQYAEQSNGTPQEPVISVAALEQQLKDAGANSYEWGEWTDETVTAEITNVQGVVLWDEENDQGVMKFTGLPTNDVSDVQYQLWIIDARYGDDAMNQRVSGGVFNATSDGEITVAIDPSREIDQAVAFAVTIERPGGVWNSDMSRRVVIASAASGG